jgi:galactokinase
MTERDRLIERILAGFADMSGGENPRLFRAPGRVNLIGEHTDYNNGFVLPMAIDLETIVAAVPTKGREVRVRALDVDGEEAIIDLDREGTKQRGAWLDYVEGPIRMLQERGATLAGADLVFASSIPIGSGLSSSAALEISVSTAMLRISGAEMDPLEIAFAAQKAEHEYVGTRSGLMDQLASVFGKAGHALLIDCETNERDEVPLEIGENSVVVCDSKVKHELASSAYNERREECEAAVEYFKKMKPEVSSLRDVTLRDLETSGNGLSDVIQRRCRHVITENDRTLAAAAAFREADLETIGELMYGSHRSLRDDYEVSCPELDLLVETASAITGVHGARMTGGGFGGCTVNLIRTDQIDEFRSKISKRYKDEFGKDPEVFPVTASDGASELPAV